MKKIILMFIMLIGIAINSSAQVNYYKTTSFASAKVYNGRYYWSDWEKSDLTIVMNLNTDVITIYSPTVQVYRIVNTQQTYRDSSGGTQVAFTVYDQDDDRGTLRLRIESNGNSQIYIDFSNIAWCYNVYRIQ